MKTQSQIGCCTNSMRPARTFSPTPMSESSPVAASVTPARVQPRFIFGNMDADQQTGPDTMTMMSLGADPLLSESRRLRHINIKLETFGRLSSLHRAAAVKFSFRIS